MYISIINLYYIPAFPSIFYIQENSDNFGFILTLESSLDIERLKIKLQIVKITVLDTKGQKNTK